MAKEPVNNSRKKQDAVIYKAMLDMLITVIVLMLLRLINRHYSTSGGFEAWREAFRWISVGGAAVAAAGLILMLLKKKPTLAAWLLCVGAAVAAVALLFFRYWVSPLPWLTFLTVAAGALYLVWLLYPHDFFLVALLTTGCGGAFYLHGKNGLGLTVSLLYAVMAILLVLSFLAARKASGNSGVFRSGKLRFRLYNAKGTPVPLYLCCAVWAACIAAALALGGVFAYYCVYVAAGALFIAACYYTIRLD